MLKIKIGLVILTLSLLQGCAGVLLGGAAAGIGVAHDRRTTGSVIEDQAVENKAYAALREDEALHEQVHINVTSYNQIVLLTGEAPTPELKARAEEIVRGVEKVRHVVNELQIAAPSALLARSSDALITTKVKTALFNHHVDPTLAKVVTEAGVVYLMGVVTHTEADLIVNAVADVGGVQRVVKVFEYVD